MTGRRPRTGPLGEAVDVQIEAGSAYEILMSLLVFSRPGDADSYDVGRDWFQSTRQRMSPALTRSFAALSPPAWLWLRLLGTAYDMPRPRTATQLIANLLEAPPQLISNQVFGCTVVNGGITPEVVDDARRADPAARARISKFLLAGDQAGLAAFRRLVSLPAGQLKQLIADTVEAWYRDVFRAREVDSVRVLASEVRAKQALGMTSPTRFVRLATNGIDYTPEPHITRILLIPSLITRPWVAATTHQQTKIFCYPAGDDPPAHGDEPPARLLRIQRALGNQDRLRILRLIGNGVWTVDELSRRLGLPTSRVRSHLVLLRAARLVDLEMGAELSRMSGNVPATVYRALKEYLPPLTGSAVATPAPTELRPVRRRRRGVIRLVKNL